jgi:integrase
MRHRDRQSSSGLLPRMEARPWADGKTMSYRYHPVGGKPMNLGTDKQTAIQKVLDLNQRPDDKGTVNELWRLYQQSLEWKALAESTRTFYANTSKQLLELFGEARAALIRPADVNRYLRVERSSAPVVANREVALLSNLLNLAVSRGDMDANPCKQIRRNKETPRSEAPAADDLQKFVAWMVGSKLKQRKVIAHMAEFAAYSGARRMEFLDISPQQIDREKGVIRVMRGKQRGGVRVWDEIAIGPQMADLLDRMEIEPGALVFRNKFSNAYTEQGFKANWSKMVKQALGEKIISRRFTFHDLRAFYASTHKSERGTLPDLHKNPATTARIYDRNKTVKRGAL